MSDMVFLSINPSEDSWTALRQSEAADGDDTLGKSKNKELICDSKGKSDWEQGEQG